MSPLKILVLCRPSAKDVTESYIPALWIKELRRQVPLTVTCVSMDRENSTPLLERYFDYGVDDVFLLSDKNFAGADTFATSYILYQAICNLGLEFDLIIADALSSYGETGHIPAQVAAFFNIPFATNVSDVQVAADHILCKQVLNSYEEQVSMSYPCVISLSSIVDADFLHRNSLTLFDLIANHHKEVKIMSGEQLGISKAQSGLPCSYTTVASAIKMSGKNEHIIIDELSVAILELSKIIKGVN